MNSRRFMPDIGVLPPWCRSVYRTLNLPQRGRLALGADLNCSESRLAGPQSASSHTRIAHGERLGGHGVGCTTHFSALGVHVRPARSIFSNALNLCRSAIASFVRSPWRYCPTRLLCRPAKGHAAAAPPSSVMNSRRHSVSLVNADPVAPVILRRREARATGAPSAVAGRQ